MRELYNLSSKRVRAHAEWERSTTRGELNTAFVDRFAEEFGLDDALFEEPNKLSQFAFLEHFWPLVQPCNVRLEELLRVEIFRRGLHSDAFAIPRLRPG